MNPSLPPLRRSLMAVLCAATALAYATPPKVQAPAAAAASAVKKDIALESTDPIGQIADRVTPAPVMPTATPALLRTPAHDSVTGSALAELGLDMLRQQSAAQGNAQVNSVVSPISLAYALGLLQAGTAGASQQELQNLLGSQTLGRRIYTQYLPDLRQRMAQPNQAGVPFVMANRVWLDQRVAASVQKPYAASVMQRYSAEGVALDFAQAEPARTTINQWVSQQTRERIPSLMPQGSITPNTRLVLTNAVHFKSRWADTFDPASTTPQPFKLLNGQSKPIPTMTDERPIRQGKVDGNEVLELPFANRDYALLIGMPPPGHTLDALEKDLSGMDLHSWSSQLDKAKTCLLSLPKFSLTPPVQSLKAGLQAQGVRSLFSNDSADFSPMLGAAAKGLALDDVYQGVSITIDETGGEAAAATGAAVSAKSFRPPSPVCAVNRAFVFAVMHLPSGTPLFVGKVADPTLP